MPSLKINNTGIFLGLISLPFGHEKTFYEKEFEEELFPGYKNSVKEHFNGIRSKSADIFEKYLYRPSAYYLFGRFDLAILSLIDDFEFGCRRFHPFDPFTFKGKKDYFENFKYQIISGHFQEFPANINKNNNNSNDSNKKVNSGVIELASTTFLAEKEKKPPLIGICSLKLNNSLLIGSGAELLKNVTLFLKLKTDEILKEDQTTKVMMVISYSWHELVLLIFSDSYKKISNLILNIREINLGDLQVYKNYKNKIPGDEIPGFEYSDFVIRNHSLNAEMISINDMDNLDIDKTHVFENSISIFGFDFEIYKDIDRKGCDQTSLLGKISADDIHLFTRWFTRPGHLKNAAEAIQPGDSTGISLCIGKGDFIYPYPYPSETREKFNTRKYIEDVVKAVKKEDVNRHIMESYTIVDVPWKYREISLPDVNKDHFYFLKNLPCLRVVVEKIEKIRKRMQVLGVPKVLKAKILNIFSNFNDGILDTVLYGYFFELHGAIKTVIEHIEEKSRTAPYDQLKILNRFLNVITNDFEKAYLNRFHQSYRMSELTDFTIDYKGGIHQLAACFDSAFNAICSQLGNHYSFAYVSGDPYVLTNQFSIRLNYFHIFQPEIFVAIASHEAANFLPLARLDPQKEKFKKLWEIFSKSEPDERKISTDLKTGELSWEDKKYNRSQQTKIEEFLKSLDNNVRDLKFFITAKYFRYVTADLISFYFTYQQDVELFTYWYWNVFMQTPDVYERSNVLNEDQFLGFLLRFQTVLKLAQIKPDTVSSGFPNEKLKSYMEKWAAVSLEFLEGLIAVVPDIGLIFKEMQELLYTIFKRAYKNIKRTIDPNQTIPEATKFIKEMADKIRTSLDAGEVWAFDLNNIDHFQFTQAVFYGYLKLIKEKAGPKNSVLRRDKRGMPVIDKKHDGKFLFDPTGGIFTHDPEIRQEYYKYRAALTMTLWDMGMRVKKRAIAKKMAGEFGDINVYRYLLALWKGRDILKSNELKLKEAFLGLVNDYCSRIVKEKKGCYAVYLLWGRLLEMYADSQEKVEKKKKYNAKANERFKQAGKLNSRAWARHEIDLKELDELESATLGKQDKNNVLYRLVSQY